MLKNGRWKRRKSIQTKAKAKFDRIEDFMVAQPLEGLGASMDLVKRLCSDDPETPNLIDLAVKRRDGPPPGNQNAAKGETTVDIVNNCNGRPDGNSKDRALRHLREKRPGIHARLIAKEISPHAGMVEAPSNRPDP